MFISTNFLFASTLSKPKLFIFCLKQAINIEWIINMAVTQKGKISSKRWMCGLSWTSSPVNISWLFTPPPPILSPSTRPGSGCQPSLRLSRPKANSSVHYAWGAPGTGRGEVGNHAKWLQRWALACCQKTRNKHVCEGVANIPDAGGATTTRSRMMWRDRKALKTQLSSSFLWCFKGFVAFKSESPLREVYTYFACLYTATFIM